MSEEMEAVPMADSSIAMDNDGGYMNGFSEKDNTGVPFRNQGDFAGIKRDDDATLLKKRRPSKRMMEVESFLQSQHVAPSEQKVVLLNIQQLEDDLAMVKRSLGQKKSVMRTSKAQRLDLVNKIDGLESKIKELASAIDKKEKTIHKLRSEALAYKEDVEHLQGEKAGLQLEQSRVLEEQTTLSACAFLPASRVYVTPEQLAEMPQVSPQPYRHHKNNKIRRNSKKRRSKNKRFSNQYEPPPVEPPRPTRPSPTSVILELIAQSRSTIDVMCHAFCNVRLGYALAAASSNGVRVRVMLDATWLEMTVKSASVSKPRQNWEAIHRRWSATGVKVQPQHGPLQVPRPAPIYAPFRHNSIIVDGNTLLIGPYQFADSFVGEDESSLVVVHAQSEAKNECISDVQSLFESIWSRPFATLMPMETTVVKLPPLLTL